MVWREKIDGTLFIAVMSNFWLRIKARFSKIGLLRVGGRLDGWMATFSWNTLRHEEQTLSTLSLIWSCEGEKWRCACKKHKKNCDYLVVRLKVKSQHQNLSFNQINFELRLVLHSLSKKRPFFHNFYLFSLDYITIVASHHNIGFLTCI